MVGVAVVVVVEWYVAVMLLRWAHQILSLILSVLLLLFSPVYGHPKSFPVNFSSYTRHGGMKLIEDRFASCSESQVFPSLFLTVCVCVVLENSRSFAFLSLLFTATPLTLPSCSSTFLSFDFHSCMHHNIIILLILFFLIHFTFVHFYLLDIMYYFQVSSIRMSHASLHPGFLQYI